MQDSGELNNNSNVPAIYEKNIECLSTPFGKYLKTSRICPICLRSDHMQINRMRGQDHMTFGEISAATGIALKSLKLHFDYHFEISRRNQDIINIKEDTSGESKEIINRLLEGEVDLFGGAVSVLESKAQRLNPIKKRLNKLTDDQEIDSLEDIDIQEFIMLNKLAEDIENSIMKVYQIIDKKLFPANQEDLAKAVLSYKLSILSKFVDNIITVFLEFENDPKYTELIQQLRMALSKKISILESAILKSGGVMKDIDESDESKKSETKIIS